MTKKIKAPGPKKTVAVDLDGTLARYDHWQGLDHIGEPLPGAVNFTRHLSRVARVLIFTTRCSLAAPQHGTADTIATLTKWVRDWLDLHGFVYDEIWVGQGKPIAAAIVDDRAVSCRPQEDPLAYTRALVRVTGLLET